MVKKKKKQRHKNMYINKKKHYFLLHFIKNICVIECFFFHECAFEKLQNIRLSSNSSCSRMQEDFKRLFKHHLFKPQLSLIFSHICLQKLPCRAADHAARFNTCTRNVKVTGKTPQTRVWIKFSCSTSWHYY